MFLTDAGEENPKAGHEIMASRVPACLPALPAMALIDRRRRPPIHRAARTAKFGDVASSNSPPRL
jgi:hypothetical protein